jgi:hypothetical protein
MDLVIVFLVLCAIAWLRKLTAGIVRASAISGLVR